MMTKIFLTGEIQIGKSTVINRTLGLLQEKAGMNITVGGFRTYFGPDRRLPDRLLYMNAATESKIYSEANAVAMFVEGVPPYVLTDKFNTYGADLVRDSRNNADLILMDECGSLEKDALEFQEQILQALTEKTPVLGVIKLSSSGWTDLIRNHPQIELITVTKENRDFLPDLLAGRFGDAL